MNYIELALQVLARSEAAFEKRRLPGSPLRYCPSSTCGFGADLSHKRNTTRRDNNRLCRDNAEEDVRQSIGAAVREDPTEDRHTTINVNANKRHGPPAAAKKTIGSELAHSCDVFFLSSLDLRLSANRVSCAEKANNCSERSLGER